MATITRSDGLQFVVQAYRELLPMASRAHLIREIRTLADQQGSYCYLARKSTGEIEAVFAKETGYLLGESLWHFFEKPDNLIYVEALPENHQLLLIVIRKGSVYIDAKIASKDLQEELIPLMTGNEPYSIRVHGDVTLKFPDSLTSSFENLSKSVFNQLLANPDLSLRPLAFALKSPALGKNHVPILITGIIVVGVFAGLSFFHSGRPVLVSVPHLAPAANPFAEYERALSTAEPSDQLAHFVEVIKDLYFIPGWRVSGLKMEGGEYQITLQSEGGNLESLLNWSKQKHFSLRMTGQAVILKRKIKLKKRPIPANIYSLNQVVSLLVDELDELLENKVVELGNSEAHGGAEATPMTINLNKTSPEIIDLLGRELENLPLELKSVDISFKDGLIDGSIQLFVWGRKNANG
jgi:hypothetical protein